MKNINTFEYWEKRFASGDWKQRGGYNQTRLFALSQIKHIELPHTFSGTLCDFGCGAGDAFPVYREAFPKAKLIGIDFSESAIQLCREKFGSIAEFICGDIGAVPNCDVIISSNVLEHLSNDKRIAKELREKCKMLYIIVPYREQLQPGSEHVNAYELTSFDYLGAVRKKTFYSLGWSHHGLAAAYHVHFKNLIRPLLGRPRVQRERQVMFIAGGQ